MKKELNIDVTFRKRPPSQKELDLFHETYNLVQHQVLKLLGENVSKESIKSVVEMALDVGLDITMEERKKKMMELHNLIKGKK